MTYTELAAEVMKYAESRYEDGGWDVVVECWTLEEIAAALEESLDADQRTPDGAIKYFEGLASIWADRQADARNSAF